jgi:polysaccharide biosynthesis transport protein
MHIMIMHYLNLFRRHKIVLTLLPLATALLTFILIRMTSPQYQSKVIINTGFASGVSIESVGSRAADYFAANNAFDNLVNIIESRKTKEEVAIRLLAAHLMLKQSDPDYLSENNYNKLQKLLPAEIKNLASADTERTVARLTAWKNSSRKNFIINILYHSHPHYSLQSLKQIAAVRMATSDLLEIGYQSDDPGVSRQTLVILLTVVAKNFRDSKASNSSDVVAYFVEQLRLSSQRLQDAEERYANFNKTHNIINYYEETKSIANHRDDFDVTLRTEKMTHAGAEASLQYLESVLPKSDLDFLQSQDILAKRNQLADITAQIATLQLADSTANAASRLTELRARAGQLKNALREELVKLQRIGRSLDHLPINQVLDRWLENAILTDESKARLSVLRDFKKEFEQYYETFSPLGSLIKRHEREISVLENEYLELLHSLTLAKLQQQNIEIANQLRIIDDPSYPLEPEGQNTKKFLLLAFLGGFLLAMAIIIVFDYFSAAIKNADRAKVLTGLDVLAVLPAGAGSSSSLQPFTEFTCRQLELKRLALAPAAKPFTVYLFNEPDDGGTFPVGDLLASRLQARGLRASVVHEAALNRTGGMDWPAAPKDQSAWAEVDYLFVEAPFKSGAQSLRFIGEGCYSLLVCRHDQYWKQGDRVALNNLVAVLPGEIQCLFLTSDDDECRAWLGIPYVTNEHFFSRLTRRISKDDRFKRRTP